MPDLTPDTIADAATQPASAAQDGRSASAVSIPDQIAANNYAEAADALSGDNDNGGGKSGWGNRVTRKARARFKGAS